MSHDTAPLTKTCKRTKKNNNKLNLKPRIMLKYAYEHKARAPVRLFYAEISGIRLRLLGSFVLTNADSSKLKPDPWQKIYSTTWFPELPFPDHESSRESHNTLQGNAIRGRYRVRFPQRGRRKEGGAGARWHLTARGVPIPSPLRNWV